MKKILFPTDFSAPAANALAHAVALANRFGCQLTLLHTYKVHQPAGALVSIESYLAEDARNDMDTLAADIQSQLDGGASLDTLIRRGEAITTIADVAHQGHYDLIVMGTKGATGLKEILLGSITAGVVKETDLPVLAIPDDYAPRPVNNIVLALDQGGLSGPEVTTVLVAISRAYEAVIRVFHQDMGPGDIGIDPGVEACLEGASHSFYYELDDDEVNRSIHDFAEEVNAEMLCMVRRRRSFLEDIFHVSATAHAVNHINRPLLVLHDRHQM